MAIIGFDGVAVKVLLSHVTGPGSITVPGG